VIQSPLHDDIPTEEGGRGDFGGGPGPPVGIHGETPTPSGPLRDPEARGRWASWATALALLFLLASLLALVLGPPYWGGAVEEIRVDLRDTVRPGVSLAGRIELAQSRQMLASQGFLLSGDVSFRLQYREALREEDYATAALRSLTAGMSEPVRERLAHVEVLSASWRMSHQEMLSREQPLYGGPPLAASRELLESLARQRAIYGEILAASANLREALALEMLDREGKLAETLAKEARWTRYLVLLGLAATVVVILLGWRLRQLVLESEARRLDALRARRDVDALLGATGDGVIGLDLEGRCTFLNRAGAELLGYGRREVVGKDFHHLLHHSMEDGSPHPREACPILEAVAAGGTFSGRNEVFWGAGRRAFPVRVSLRPMRDGTELKGAVLSFTDMTETREAEESLRQAVQAREEVLGVVSHDLRNPLGTIYSAASLLLDLELTPEKRRAHLETVKRSAERMNRLIRDLLDVALLEAGGFRVIPSPFNVRELVLELLVSQRLQAVDAGVQLRSHVPDEVGEAWGDRDRILQALGNLVENALRLAPRGGQVEVSARTATQGGELHLSVADTGPGISPEDQERLFDRFWQVSRKDKLGAGLGLSIAKGIVEAHGGRIWVESREGDGSTFWLSIPPGPRDEAEGSPPVEFAFWTRVEGPGG
jgi:PAS domain S-box-containing protein